jgi:hypothetical protein
LLFVSNIVPTLKSEGDFAVHPKPGDLPVLDDRFELLDVNGANIAQGLSSSVHHLARGILPTLL